MMAERINALTQPRFAAVLRYFQYGDFTRFGRAADLALGSDSTIEPFFCANLLFAWQISGLCEVSSVTGATRWWISQQDEIRIPSPLPKVIGTSSEWFSANASGTVPLVTDSKLSPLVLGARWSDSSVGATTFLFNEAFADLVPAYKDIEKQLCVEAPFHEDVIGSVDVFRPSVCRWETTTLDDITGSQLLRVRKEYSGFVYYVQHSNLGLRFRITQPEWAFVVAYHLLPWRLADILAVENANVRVHRAVRLPVLLCRTLFAAAEAVRVGPVVTFENVSSRCIDGVLRYFESAGERQ